MMSDNAGSRTTLEAAAALIDLGLHVLLLRGKVPASEHGYLDATIDAEELVVRSAAIPDATNLGVAPGRSGYIVLDLDETKDAGKVPALIRLHRAAEEHGGLPETLTVRTGSGGRHLWFRGDPQRVLGQANGIRHPDTGRTESGVDYRGIKGYVVVPPSIHPSTGKPYRWESPSGQFEASLVRPIPAWLIAFLDPPKPKLAQSNWTPPETPPPVTGTDQRRVAGMVALACDEIGKLGEGMGRRTELQRAAYRLAGLCWTGYPVDALRGSLQSAAHACGHWDEDTRRTIDCAIDDGLAKPYPLPPDSPDWASRTSWRERYASALRNWASFHRPDDEDDEGRVADQEEFIPPDLETTKDGRPRDHLLNLTMILDSDPEWRGRLEWCEFTGGPTIDRGPVTDEAEGHLAVWLGQEYRVHPPMARLHEAVRVVCHRHRHHPIREYLESLTWDGIDRLDHWLVDYAGAEAGPLIGAYGRKTLIGAVARIVKPGAKNDTVLTFRGRQGAGKSTVLAVLAGASWFSDSPLKIGDKDGCQSLRGVWIYELAELDSVRRQEWSTVKAFLSTQVDRYRPSYGRNTIEVARQCIFVGSTNLASFLSDPTGSRRFWVVDVTGDPNPRSLATVRDQLWAEAYARYRDGEPWWLTSEEDADRAEDAERYREADPWDELVASATDGLAMVRAKDLLVRILRTHSDQREETILGAATKADEMRLGNILTATGWVRKEVNGKRAWVRK